MRAMTKWASKINVWYFIRSAHVWIRVFYGFGAPIISLEKTINNIPGVLENGLFVGVADIVLVGEIKDGQPIVREM